MARGKVTNLEDILSKYAANKEEEVIPTGIDSIDSLLGGGLTPGYTFGFWGTPGAGKSTVCLQILKNFCKQGKKCAVIDVEKSISQKQQESFGIDKYVADGTLVILACSFINEYEEIMTALINSQEFSLIMVDSVTFLQPYVKQGLTVEDIRPGIKSLQISQVGPKLKAASYNNGVIILSIYQARANLDMTGNMYAPKDKVAAGFSEQHLVDALLKISVSSKIKDDNDEIIGNKVWLTTEKNKFATPGKKVQSTLIFGKGISKRIDLIDNALEMGLITQSGATFTLPFDEKKVRGRKALYDLPSEDMKKLQELVHG